MNHKYFLYLSGLISENQYIEETQLKHYMFFSNLKSIQEKVNNLLQMDAERIDEMLDDGHDWANDHITSSRDDIEEVYNWITTNMKG